MTYILRYRYPRIQHQVNMPEQDKHRREDKHSHGDKQGKPGQRDKHTETSGSMRSNNEGGQQKSHRTKNPVPAPFPDSGHGGNASRSDPTRGSGAPDGPPSTQPSPTQQRGSRHPYTPLAPSPFAPVTPLPAPRPAPQPYGYEVVFDPITGIPRPCKLPAAPGTTSLNASSSNEPSIGQQGGSGPSYGPPASRATDLSPYSELSPYSSPYRLPGSGQFTGSPSYNSPYTPITQPGPQQNTGVAGPSAEGAGGVEPGTNEDNKPVECPKCKKRYAGRPSMLGHFRQHHFGEAPPPLPSGPSCDRCDFQANGPQGAAKLEEHKARVHGISNTIYECPFKQQWRCRDYLVKADAKNHIRMKHFSKVEPIARTRD